jgi:hypothetical protein
MKFSPLLLCKRVFLGIVFLGAGWFAVEVLPWKMGPSPPMPTEAFQKFLGQPVSEGVSNLVVVNRQYVIKSWCWMSFQTTDRALASLLRTGHGTDSERVVDPFLVNLALRGVRGVAHSKYDSVDKQTVGWNRVLKLPKPEVYKLSSFSESEGFFRHGDMIVDRESRWVYILSFTN